MKSVKTAMYLLTASILIVSFNNCRNFESSSASALIPISNPTSNPTSNTSKSIIVSPDGSDQNAGTLDKPTSIKGALAKLAELNKQNPGGYSIILKDGIYPISSTIQITNSHSGTSSAPNVLVSNTGAKPVLLGGKTLSKSLFKSINCSDASDALICTRLNGKPALSYIRKFDLSQAGLTLNSMGVLSRHGFSTGKTGDNFNTTPPSMLYIGGKAMTLARWPNAGDSLVTIAPGTTSTASTGQPSTFLVNYSKPTEWVNTGDIWLAGLFGQSWEWSYNKLTSFDVGQSSSKVTLAYREESDTLPPSVFAAQFNQHHYENVLEELDVEGEYFINRDSNNLVLYLYPPSGFLGNTSEAWLSTTDTILKTVEVSNFLIKNITFDTSRSYSILIQKSNQVVFENCEFKNASEMAVSISSTSRRCGIRNSHIHDIGKTGISIQGGVFANQDRGDNFVENSDIHDTGAYNKVYTPGVAIYGYGNIVKNSKIHDIRHAAVIAYGNEQTIAYNEIYNTCTEFSDMSAIYMNTGAHPHNRGNSITRNFFHDIGNSDNPAQPLYRHAIYLDNQTMGVVVKENIFYKISNNTEGVAILINSGSYIYAENNFFLNTKVPYKMSSYATVFNYEDKWAKNFAAAQVLQPWEGATTTPVPSNSDPLTCPTVCDNQNGDLRCPYFVKFPKLCSFWADWNSTKDSQGKGHPRYVSFQSNYISDFNTAPGGVIDEFYNGNIQGSGVVANYNNRMFGFSDPINSACLSANFNIGSGDFQKCLSNYYSDSWYSMIGIKGVAGPL